MDVRVAIVGGGLMGLSAAWALGKRGVQATVVDPLPRRTERNASNDESKIFRLAYADLEPYSRLALASLAGWEALERASHRTLLHRTGLLLLEREPGFASATGRTLTRLGREPGWLDGPGLEEAYPPFAGGGYARAVLDRDAGFLDPPAVLEALEAEAGAARARIVRGFRVAGLEREGARWAVQLERGVRLRAERVIVAAGHRAPLLLPELGPLLTTTRQPEFFFEPPDPAPFEPARFPVYAAFEDGFYGFPRHRGALKVADHRLGPAVPPEPPMDPPTRDEEARCRDWLRRALPPLADAPLARSRLCFYDMTPDEDFLLGPHPQREGVLLAVGFSGHGFKFAPAVGEALAAMVLGEEPAKEWSRCDPARLLR